ncbi:MAG: hypothetical protein IH804_06685, partial [Planctomycetes bacterium]|nr:hypothetical protein [Planctomycetota bacterium]
MGGDYPLERSVSRGLARQGFHVALVHRKTLKISPEHDLARFAWTWDATNLFIYLELFGPRIATSYQWVYVDSNFDGVLTSSVFRIEGTEGELTVIGYAPDEPGGDPLADGAGLADGYTMPGSDTSLRFVLSSGGGTVQG